TTEVPYYLIAANFWEIVNRSYMYSIGGVAGARTPNNAECFTAEPDSRLRKRGTERDLRHLQPAETGSPALHVRPDGEVHGSLRARALQPHPRVGGRGQPGQHLPRPAQPGRRDA